MVEPINNQSSNKDVSVGKVQPPKNDMLSKVLTGVGGSRQLKGQNSIDALTMFKKKKLGSFLVQEPHLQT